MVVEGGKACSISEEKIISTGQLGGEGFVTTFIDQTWKVTKGAPGIEKGDKVGTLYL